MPPKPRTRVLRKHRGGGTIFQQRFIDLENLLTHFKGDDNKCDLSKFTDQPGVQLIYSLHEHEKPSKSGAHIILCNTPNNLLYVLKLYIWNNELTYTPENKRKFENENNAYKILNTSFITHNCPHITYFIYSTQCARTFSLGNKVPMYKQNSETPRRSPFTDLTFLKQETVGYIAMEQSSGKTLQQIFDSLTLEEFKVVVFQILYTILCLQRVDFLHTDMHSNNIFVERSSATNTFSYKVNDDTFVFETNIFVKLYDFDQYQKSSTRSPHLMCGANHDYRRAFLEIQHLLQQRSTNLEATDKKEWFTHIIKSSSSPRNNIDIYIYNDYDKNDATLHPITDFLRNNYTANISTEEDAAFQLPEMNGGNGRPRRRGAKSRAV